MTSSTSAGARSSTRSPLVYSGAITTEAARVPICSGAWWGLPRRGSDDGSPTQRPKASSTPSGWRYSVPSGVSR